MTRPSAADDLYLYLAAFNAELTVGLRSRGRVLQEVQDHLQEAAAAEWEVLRDERSPAVAEARDGEVWAEAQRRAITAFGTPRAVASRSGVAAGSSTRSRPTCRRRRAPSGRR